MNNILLETVSSRPQISVIAYSKDEFIDIQVDDLQWIEEHKNRFSLLWISLGDIKCSQVVSELGRIFNLHKLALEDVVQGNQRPKVDNYEEHLFIGLHVLYNRQGRVAMEQLSIILGHNFIISFHSEVVANCLMCVKERLRKDVTRSHAIIGVDFLAYNLIDAVIDAYFPYLEEMGENLEKLEDHIMLDPVREVVCEIHNIKRDLMVVRRAVWPLREAINQLMRENTRFITRETQMFLRDAYDHCVQVIDLLETYRELGSSLMDIYLSSISNKMNEVMKVLTIITTIFVPLTFVAGLYGMNFNPEKSPFNMPELHSYYGYPLCLLGMSLIAGLEIYCFWRKGWLGNRRTNIVSSSSTRFQ